MVAEHRDAIVAVANALAKRRVLSGAEVKGVIETTRLAKTKTGVGRTRRGGPK